MMQPAVKLLDFFAGIAKRNSQAAEEKLEIDSLGLPILDTAKLQHFSATMRDIQPLGPHHAQSWIKYWKKKSFLP